MTDYTKYKKVISKYKFKRILQNRRADLCVVYYMKKFGKDYEPKQCAGVLIGEYLYTPLSNIQSLNYWAEDSSEAFRYKVDGEFRADSLAFFPVCKLFPF